VHVGPDSLLVAGKIAVRETDSAAQVAADINAAEKRVRIAVPIATTIYLEPDIYRPALADQTDPSIRAVLRSRAPRSPRSSRAPRLRRRDRPTAPESPATPDNPSTPDKLSAQEEPSPPDKLSAQDKLSVSDFEKPSPSAPEKPREHEPPT